MRHHPTQDIIATDEISDIPDALGDVPWMRMDRANDCDPPIHFSAGMIGSTSLHLSEAERRWFIREGHADPKLRQAAPMLGLRTCVQFQKSREIPQGGKVKGVRDRTCHLS